MASQRFLFVVASLAAVVLLSNVSVMAFVPSATCISCSRGFAFISNENNANVASTTTVPEIPLSIVPTLQRRSVLLSTSALFAKRRNLKEEKRKRNFMLMKKYKVDVKDKRRRIARREASMRKRLQQQEFLIKLWYPHKVPREDVEDEEGLWRLVDENERQDEMTEDTKLELADESTIPEHVLRQIKDDHAPRFLSRDWYIAEERDKIIREQEVKERKERERLEREAFDRENYDLEVELGDIDIKEEEA